MKALLIRPSRNEEDAAALSVYGIESSIIPLIGISNLENPIGVQRMIAQIRANERIWFIATSSNAIEAFVSQVDREELAQVFKNPNLRFAAVGESSASSLKAFAEVEVLVPDVHDAYSLALAIIEFEAQDQSSNIKPTVVMPIGSRSLVVAQEKLALEGFDVIAEIVYQNLPIQISEPEQTEIASSDIDFVLFRSPSSAKAYFALQGVPDRMVISVGATTTAAIKELGFVSDLACVRTTPESVAQQIAEHLAQKERA
jgi:uroporphyrinogen-III synthase